jgi:hypothetical protein
MTETEKALDAFFADDGLPIRDQAFTLAVMDRAARRRLRLELLRLAGICMLAALVLWSLAPGLQKLGSWLGSVVLAAGPVLGVLALVATVVAFTTPREPRFAVSEA